MGTWKLTEGGLYLPEKESGAWERVAQNRYVAHLDMLGMSGLTLRDPKLAWSAISRMINARKRRPESLSYQIDGRRIRIAEHVSTFTFSDTILLFTKGDEPEDLRSILFSCLELFSLLLNQGIPVRIGVAHGLFIFNQEEYAFVGPPLVEAYKMGEGAQWLGIVLDQMTARKVSELKPPLQDANARNIVVQWNVPKKSDVNSPQPVLAWPRSHSRNFLVPPPITIEQFYQAFEPLFGPIDGLRPADRDKYKNTLAFVNEMLKS